MLFFSALLRHLRGPHAASAQPAGLPPLPAPTARAILARCVAVWTSPGTSGA